MTYVEIKQQCEKYHPGDTVLVNVVKRDEDGRKAIYEKVEGTIKDLSNHFVVVERGGILESFTYTDIVLHGALEKKERKSRARKQAKRIC